MKYQKRFLYNIFAVLILFTLVSGAFSFKHVAAAGGSIAVSPSSVSLINGNTTTVSVVATTNGTTISTADIALVYDATKLQVISVAAVGLTEGANYTDNHTGTVQGGAYKSTAPYPAGGTLLSVVVKAKVGSGSTALQLSTAGAYGTEVDNADGSGSLNLPLSNSTINFTQPACPAGYSGTYPSCVAPAPPTPTPPAPSCPSGYTGSYPNCVAPVAPSSGTKPTTGSSTGSTSKPGSTTSPKPTSTSPTTTAPATPAAGGNPSAPVTTSDGSATVATKQIQFTNAVVTATSPVPTQVYVAYGLSGSELSQQTNLSDLATTHDISLNDANLMPGQTYYYMVVSKDATGTVSKSSVQTFTTRGINVTIGVFDVNHKPVANKQVTLHSTAYTAKTDAKGEAVFQNVAPGAHELTYAASKKTYMQKLSVANAITTAADGTQTAKPQNFSVVYNLTQTSHTGTLVAVSTILLLLAAAVAFVIVRPNEARELLAKLRPQRSTEPVLTTEPVIITQQETANGSTEPFMEPWKPDVPQPGSTFAPVAEHEPQVAADSAPQVQSTVLPLAQDSAVTGSKPLTDVPGKSNASEQVAPVNIVHPVATTNPAPTTVIQPDIPNTDQKAA